jgi:LysR family nitrogen assimilation transcriptional regulator
VGVPLIKRVLAEHPAIKLHIIESLSAYLAELLAQGRLDMAVLIRDADIRRKALVPLLQEDLFLLGDPPGRTVPDDVCPMSVLGGVPMALPSPAQGLRILIERSFSQAGIELNVIADVDAFPTNIALARDGFACTILPRTAVIYLGLEKRPPVRRLVKPGISRPVSLAWSTSLPRTNAAIAVQKILVDLIIEMVKSGEWTGVRLAESVNT